MPPNPNRMIHFSPLRRPRLLGGIAAVLVIGGGWFGYRKFSRTQATDVPAEEKIFMTPTRVVELLRSQCVECHNKERPDGGLALDSLEGLLTGGKSGPALVPGDEPKSLLLHFSHSAKGVKLPGSSRLWKRAQPMLERWIEDGAAWPQERPVELLGDAWSDPRNPIRTHFKGARLDLWSMKPIAPPPVPEKSGEPWGRNPIDAFVLENMQSGQARPAPEADRRTLGRRLYFDLTGLPPSPQEMKEFMEDGSPDAYEKLVTRLLDSPAYGVRFGQMWLDLVRYSDSNGFDYDEFRPQAWRYRDYVVRSLNADKPYDQFVLEQLAGDELVPEYPETAADQDRLTATGFLRIGPYDNSAVKFGEEDRCHAQVMSDIVETTSAAFLGLNFSCCRCHDHKTDPLTQQDYYRLRGCFESIAPNDRLLLDLAPQQRTIAREVGQIEALQAKLAEMKVQPTQRAMDLKIKVLGPDDQNFLTEYFKDRTNVNLKGRYKNLKHRIDPTEAEIVAALREEEKAPYNQVTAQIEELHKKRSQAQAGFLVTEHTSSPLPTRLLRQGDFTQPREVVPPGVPSIFDPNPINSAKPVRQHSSGVRSAFVKWLFGEKNPLTARVMVNRLWQFHFGTGLQASASDFGFAGTKPTHPGLLDWLAAEFRRQGWSIKKMHRLIVESATYRQALGSETSAQPEVLAGRVPQRLSAEALRDSMLHVSGILLPCEGGPPRWPKLPTEVLNTNPGLLVENDEKTRGWYPSPPETLNVRSIYLVAKRSLRLPMLETFDQPESNQSCARRIVSTVAPQALVLLNDDFTVQVSQAFADRLTREAAATQESLIRRAYELALQREPDAEELASCQEFMGTHTLPELCRTILNLNEFSYVD